MKDGNERQGITKSEPAIYHPHGCGSTEAPSSDIKNLGHCQLWERSNQEWLRLGVGCSGRASSNVQSKPISYAEAKPSFNDEKFGQNPAKCDISNDSSASLNLATFRSVSIPGLIATAVVSDVVDDGKPELRIFGRRLVQAGTARQEFVLAPSTSFGSRNLCRDTTETERGTAGIDDPIELHRGQESCRIVEFSDRDKGLANNAGVSSISTPIADAQFRSAQLEVVGMTTSHETLQHRKDYLPNSFSSLTQWTEGLRQGEVAYSCLPQPSLDSAPRLMPMARTFQGWTSSELNSTSKMVAMGSHGTDMEDPIHRQAMRSSDEWGSSFRKVSPKMLFQSPCHLPEGSPVLIQSTGQETNVGAQEMKRVVENIQKKPQWPISTEAMSLSVASCCVNGNLQAVRRNPKRECFAGERSHVSSVLSESGPVHSGIAGDQLNLSGKPSQNHHCPQIPGKPKLQVLPRVTNHAGLWFILQPAENQNGEDGVPQISKAYLRIKDGKMPVSAVKKYLVFKLGLTCESEVEITCKGQPVVPTLPLQHVRDAIWFSSLNTNKKDQSSSGERQESVTSLFSKDILMVLTYRRHPRTSQLSALLQ